MHPSPQLSPTDFLMLGLIAVGIVFVFVYIVVRVATGHAREDFMTPREVQDYYFRGIPPERLQRNHRQDKRSLIIFFVGVVLISAMYLIFSNVFH